MAPSNHISFIPEEHNRKQKGSSLRLLTGDDQHGVPLINQLDSKTNPQFEQETRLAYTVANSTEHRGFDSEDSNMDDEGKRGERVSSELVKQARSDRTVDPQSNKEHAMMAEGTAETRIRTREKLLAHLVHTLDWQEAEEQVEESSKAQKGSFKARLLNRASSDPSRICRFCGREFPSGRALGGHMRVHGASLPPDTVETSMMQVDHQRSKRLNPLRSDMLAKTSYFNSSSSNNLDMDAILRRSHADAGNYEAGKVNFFDCASSLFAASLDSYGDGRFEIISEGSTQRRSSSANLAGKASRHSMHSCPQCRKRFPSWKALFGHMRSHPERDWRGMIQQLEDDQQSARNSPVPLFDKHLTDTPTSARRYGVDQWIKGELCSDDEGSERVSMVEGMDSAPIVKNSTSSLNPEQRPRTDIRKAHSNADATPHPEDTDDWTPPSWPTAKRSKRRRPNNQIQEPALISETTSNENQSHVKDQEDLDMANCLVLLSSAGKTINVMESTEESAYSHPGDLNQADVDDDDEEEEEPEAEASNKIQTKNDGASTAKYQCSTCRKCFNSHQALGGHRASHRKTKGCFARTKNLVVEAEDSGEENTDEQCSTDRIRSSRQRFIQHNELQPRERLRPPSKPGTKKFKGHECSFCHRIFPSGQALGGHKRCHWTGEKAADVSSVASSNNNSNKQQFDQERSECDGRDTLALKKKGGKEDIIDLNLPAPLDEDEIGFNDVRQGSEVYKRLIPNAWNTDWNNELVAQMPQLCSMRPF